MTNDNKAEPSRVRRGKRAARETIGKLIGDDAGAAKGRKEQQASSNTPDSQTSRRPDAGKHK
ncbi:hypothetical protein [Sphingomonas sp.]|jgi:uncharacterized protein YjbJ (UPF0337 family)|uniref:hypothetical protein n=1 Tax=Sphingomonas sp. TaxID=28214 RepID=UPI0035C7B234